jgi:hypothetical protein
MTMTLTLRASPSVGRLERAVCDVYRIPNSPLNRLSQYRAAVLWPKARRMARYRTPPLSSYIGFPTKPRRHHITVPHNARLRRLRQLG